MDLGAGGPLTDEQLSRIQTPEELGTALRTAREKASLGLREMVRMAAQHRPSVRPPGSMVAGELTRNKVSDMERGIRILVGDKGGARDDRLEFYLHLCGLTYEQRIVWLETARRVHNNPQPQSFFQPLPCHRTERTASTVGPDPMPHERSLDALPANFTVRATVVGGIPSEPKHFVSRLPLRLLREESARSQIVVVVTGMRGVGKTQLAAAYARERIREARENELVGWVDAETNGSMLEGLSAVADRFGIADPNGNHRESANRLRDHLASSNQPALLIFDNATNPDSVREALPATGNCRIVITSTNREFSTLGSSLSITVYERSESIRMLHESTGLRDSEGADAIAQDLEDLPLALTQAAATITTRHLNYADYLTLLAQPLRRAFTRLSGESYPSRVDRAIQLSIDTITADSGDSELDIIARDLLDIICVLSPSGISTDLLSNFHTRFDEALACCVRASVVTRSTDGKSVRMHRLISRVLREQAETPATRDELVRKSLAVIEDNLFGLNQSWQRRLEGSHLIDHIDSMWNYGVHHATNDTRRRLFEARSWAVQHLTLAWNSDLARQNAEKTHIDLKKLMGPDHPLTIDALDQVSNSNRAFEQQRPFRSLKDNALAADKNLGPLDPLTGNYHVRLAHALRSSHQYAASVPLLAEAVAAHQKTLGTDHPRSRLLKDHLLATCFLDGRFTAASPSKPRCLICGRLAEGHADHCVDWDSIESLNRIRSA
ncbi:tetratricopeptide repeat protein [Nocardia salmonicida]|uniref:tetratricopeptide repeat protein n=1 Tax=Nocardia salmonicida TaxID=53431 RepID=UPI00371A140F